MSINLNQLINVCQRFRKPSQRLYRYNSKFSSNTFTSPTSRQLKRLKSYIDPNNSYFKKIDILCQKTKGSKILDIGTNIGYWAYAFSRSSNSKRDVIGFEPDLRNLSIAANNLSGLNGINLFHIGLSDLSGRFKVDIPPEGLKRKYEGKFNTGLMTALNNSNPLGTHFIAGDLFLEMLNIIPESIACLKIDVEGFEYKVLKGLNSTLKLTEAFLIIEINPITMKKASFNFIELVSHLNELNYISLMDPNLNIKILNGFTDKPFNMISVRPKMADYTCDLMNYIKLTI